MYSSNLADTTVRQDSDRRIWAEWTPKGRWAEPGGQPERYELLALSGDTLISAETRNGRHLPFTFLGSDPDGRAAVLFTNRVDRRAGPA